jgi:protein-S-isoprenylcysteine O-methyltransferase Ste14
MCRTALPAFLARISRGWHFCAGQQAHHYNRGTGPYRFSRNPIYLSFILLVLGLSIWLNDLWLLVMLIPAVGFIAAVVIPREERFLERIFHDQYSSYKAAVRRRL